MAAAVVDVTARLSASGQQVIPAGFEQKIVASELVPTVQSYFPRLRKASARPRRILFGYMTDPRLRLRRPISLVISRSGGSVVAHSPELDEFGQGATMSAALEDFSKALAELYFELKENSERLGDDLARLHEKVQKYLEIRASK